MDLDMQFNSGQTLPGVGAVLVLLLIVRQQPRSTSDVVIEVFMDPFLFLSYYAGLLHHLSQEKPLLQAPETQEKDLISSVPAISIKNVGDERNEELERLIARVAGGLEVNSPQLCTEGVNGTYFLKDVNGKFIALFKPEDEELSSPNNPKTQQEDSQRGILPGEAVLREVFASRLDRHLNGIFNVPMTGMVQITHPSFGMVDGNPRVKRGSIQEFVENDGSVGDMGPAVFSADEVQRIALLDLILHNTDRHEGNILYRENSSGDLQLIPIDHGFSIPDRLGGAWFDWLHYPQAKKEFSPEIKRIVMELDTGSLVENSFGLDLRPECRRTLELSCLLVKKGVDKGMTPRQLGLFASRRNPSEISPFEVLVDEAEKMGGNLMENASFLMEERLDSFRI